MDQLSTYGADDAVFAQAEQYPDLRLARVVSQYQGLYKIADAEGEGFAEVSGRFRHGAACPSDYPTVGDFVMIQRADTEKAVICGVLDRKSVFARRAAGGAGGLQLIAANIDILFICMSLNGDYNLNRLERYLSAAWESGARPVVVLTKSDLGMDAASADAEISAAAPGTDVIVTCGHDPASCEKFGAYLAPGVTASFVGSSGVGKSTLINCLAGGALQQTDGVRRDGRGKHTTTRRELIVLDQGAIVIDTPGMRECGMRPAELSGTFSDIDRLAEGGRLRDCTHTVEPGCAVLRAVETGELDRRRLENYKKLEKEAAYGELS